MTFSHTFAGNRSTPADLGALTAQLRGLDTSAVVANRLGTQEFVVEKATAWTGPQVTAAQTEIDSAPELTPQRQAQNEIDQWPIAQKALLNALLAQLNVIRSKLSPPLPPISKAAALQAARDEAGTL